MNFMDWLTMVDNKTDRKFKCLQSDNREEYKSNEFVQFYREHTIKQEFMALYCPEQNGVVERMNQTIQERIVFILDHFGLTDAF
jgi:transposase InsO family protein